MPFVAPSIPIDSRFVVFAPRLAGANIMSIIYGMDSELKDDPYIKMGEDALNIAAKVGNVGEFLVDILPFRMSLDQLQNSSKLMLLI